MKSRQTSSRQRLLDVRDVRDVRDIRNIPNIRGGEAIADGWDKVIADAQRKIADAEQSISDLRLGIKEFRRRRDAGEPWPGTVETGGSETVKSRRLHQE